MIAVSKFAAHLISQNWFAEHEFPPVDRPFRGGQGETARRCFALWLGWCNGRPPGQGCELDGQYTKDLLP